MLWKRRAAYALVRATLGIVFLFNGINKVLGGVGSFSENLRSSFSETMLPDPMVSAFGMLLPGLEIALGALLILGLFTSQVLVATGALLMVLTFGTVIQATDPSVVAHNVFYVFLVGVLLFLESSNAFALDRLRIREEMGSPPHRTEPLPPLPKEPSRRWVAQRQPRYRSRVDSE